MGRGGGGDRETEREIDRERERGRRYLGYKELRERKAVGKRRVIISYR